MFKCSQVFANLSKTDRLEAINLLIANLDIVEVEPLINLIDDFLSKDDIESPAENVNKKVDSNAKHKQLVGHFRRALRPMKHRTLEGSRATSNSKRKPVFEVLEGDSKRKRGRPKLEPDQKINRCNICKLKFETNWERLTHKESEHKRSSGKFTCDFCEKFSGTSGALRNHKRHFCTARTLTCTYCPRRFLNSRSLDRHILSEHDSSHRGKVSKRTKYCHICQKEVRKNLYEYHVASHDPQVDLSKYEKFQCENCGKKFVCSFQMTRHSCQKNSLIFKDNDGSLWCTLCLQRFKEKKELAVHKKDKHADAFKDNVEAEHFKCPYQDCNFLRPRVGDIKRHLKQSHFGVKRYRCEICHERFSKCHLKAKHLVDVHDSESKFQCEICHVECYTAYGLKDHIYMRHSEERRFPCKYCEKAFKRPGELKRHTFVHEPHLSKYVCDDCGKTFRDVSTLKAHSKVHA